MANQNALVGRPRRAADGPPSLGPRSAPRIPQPARITAYPEPGAILACRNPQPQRLFAAPEPFLTALESLLTAQKPFRGTPKSFRGKNPPLRSQEEPPRSTPPPFLSEFPRLGSAPFPFLTALPPFLNTPFALRLAPKPLPRSQNSRKTPRFTRPAAGTTALWKYRAIYMDGDEVFGQWSDVVSIAVVG